MVQEELRGGQWKTGFQVAWVRAFSPLSQSQTYSNKATPPNRATPCANHIETIKQPKMYTVSNEKYLMSSEFYMHCNTHAHMHAHTYSQRNSVEFLPKYSGKHERINGILELEFVKM